jgi:hypothetical protein
VWAAMVSTITSWLVSGGRPRQFIEMWENGRCSILFHLPVPGGGWHTVMWSHHRIPPRQTVNQIRHSATVKPKAVQNDIIFQSPYFGRRDRYLVAGDRH